MLERAQAGIEALNRKFGEDHADRFFLFHRDRQWNEGEAAWIGWERKRGKIEEFNRLLRGATDTSFSTQVGDLEVLPSVRYCITLDTDTRLPRDAAKRLIGIIAHPLNRPAARSAPQACDQGIRHPAAARQRDDGQRGGIAVRAHATPATRASTRTRPPCRTSTRICSARASSPARGCTTSMPSPPRSRGACRRTRCSRTTCSRGSTRARRSSPTSRSWTTIPPASSRMRAASTGGCAATGRSCGGCFPWCRPAPA